MHKNAYSLPNANLDHCASPQQQLWYRCEIGDIFKIKIKVLGSKHTSDVCYRSKYKHCC